MCRSNINESTADEKQSNRKNVPFETALELTGYGKNNYFVFFVCATSLCGSVTELFGLSFIVQTGACDLNLTLEQRGLLAGLPMLGIILTAYFWGYFTDVKGRRTALLVSMSIAFLFSFLSSFSPNMTTMLLLKYLSITFCSGAYATAYTLLGEFQPVKYRDKMLVLLTCANTITEFVIVIVAYPTLTYLDFLYYIPFLKMTFRPWRLMVMLLSLPMAISALCLLFIDESPKYLMSENREQEALDVLRKVYSRNTGDDGKNYPVESLLFSEDRKSGVKVPLFKSMKDQVVPLFQKQYLKYTLTISTIATLVCFVSNAFAMWLPYMVNKFIDSLNNENLSAETFCVIFNHEIISSNTSEVSLDAEICVDTINDPTYLTIFLFSIGGCLLTLLLSSIVNKLGKKLVMVLILLIPGLCGFIMNWVRVPMLSLILLIIFNYEFLTMGIIPAFVIDIYPTYIRGMAGCLSIMFSRFGGFVGIYLTGIIFEPYCEATFYIYSCLVFVCIGLVFILPSINSDDSNSKSVATP